MTRGDSSDITAQVLSGAVWKCFMTLFGEALAAEAGIWLESYDPNLKKGIIRCTHTVALKVIAALAILREIQINEKDRIKVVVASLKQSGTIRNLKTWPRGSD